MTPSSCPTHGVSVLLRSPCPQDSLAAPEHFPLDLAQGAGTCFVKLQNPTQAALAALEPPLGVSQLCYFLFLPQD